MKIMILGKKGMLGSCFLSRLAGDKDFEMYAFDKDDFDLCETGKLRECFGPISPDVVINCAGYTNVDGAEEDKEMAMKLNGEVVGEVAKLCKKSGAILIHFSTDYVFDGENEEGYKEDDEVGPISVYGKSKLMGEELIAENMSDYYIIRTSWLFGENGENFVKKIIELGRIKSEVDVVYDQKGSPTYTKDLCGAVIEHFLSPFMGDVDEHHKHELDGGGAGEIGAKLPFGIYHITNSEVTDWYTFAKKIYQMLGMKTKVKKVSALELPNPAKRPACSVLRDTKLNLYMRPWYEALKVYLELNF